MRGSERKNYETLRGRVDEKFDSIQAAHARHFACQRGCHSCCLPDLSVSLVEAEAISDWLQERPRQIDAIRATEAKNPHQGTRCALLSAEGDCLIYPVRPLLCRSHGAPTMTEPEEGALQLDVCPLNFTAPRSLEALGEGEWIHADTLSTLLAILNQLRSKERGEPKSVRAEERRVPLRLDTLLEAGDVDAVQGDH